MKKSREVWKLGATAAAALLLIAAGTASGGAMIIIQDPFDDGGYTNGADPYDTNWGSSGGTLAVVSDGGSNALQLTDTNTRDEYVHTAPFSAVSLNVGEILRLTLDMRLGQAPRDGLARYGLGFLSGTNSYWPPSYGYSVLFNLGGAAANPDIRFVKENGTQHINWNGSPDIELTASSTNLEPSVGTTAFKLQFDAKRTGTDAVELTFILTQGSNTYSFTANDTSSIYNSFQRIAIRTDQKDSETNGTFYFDNVKLEVIPEPGTIGMLLGAGGLMLLRRRPRRA